MKCLPQWSSHVNYVLIVELCVDTNSKACRSSGCSCFRILVCLKRVIAGQVLSKYFSCALISGSKHLIASAYTFLMKVVGADEVFWGVNLWIGGQTKVVDFVAHCIINGILSLGIRIAWVVVWTIHTWLPRELSIHTANAFLSKKHT